MKDRKKLTLGLILLLIALVGAILFLLRASSIEDLNMSISNRPKLPSIRIKGATYKPHHDLKVGQTIPSDLLPKTPTKAYTVIIYFNSIHICNELKTINKFLQDFSYSINIIVVYKLINICESTRELKQPIFVYDKNRKIWSNLRVQWQPRLFLIDNQNRVIYVQPLQRSTEQALVDIGNLLRNQNKRG